MKNPCFTLSAQGSQRAVAAHAVHHRRDDAHDGIGRDRCGDTQAGQPRSEAGQPLRGRKGACICSQTAYTASRGRRRRLLALNMFEEDPGPAEYVYDVVPHTVDSWARDLTRHPAEQGGELWSDKKKSRL